MQLKLFFYIFNIAHDIHVLKTDLEKKKPD